MCIGADQHSRQNNKNEEREFHPNLVVCLPFLIESCKMDLLFLEWHSFVVVLLCKNETKR
jgi:hypothetical protein